MSDNFGNQLRKFSTRLQQNAKSLHGRHSLTEIFDNGFMKAQTSFPSFEAMCAAAGVTTAEEFRALSDDVWDAHVRATTRFHDWREMQRAGVQAFAATRLRQGL